MADILSIQNKVRALAALVEKDSISPVYLGGVLDAFIDGLADIDATSRSASATAAAALDKAAPLAGKVDALLKFLSTDDGFDGSLGELLDALDSRLTSKIDTLGQTMASNLDALDTALTQQIAGALDEANGKTEAVRGQMEAVDTSLRAEILAVQTEMRDTDTQIIHDMQTGQAECAAVADKVEDLGNRVGAMEGTAVMTGIRFSADKENVLYADQTQMLGDAASQAAVAAASGADTASPEARSADPADPSAPPPTFPSLVVGTPLPVASTETAGVVTAGQVARWDAQRAHFNEMWALACGSHGCYNAETGFYELNGLTDITYEQAKRIYLAGKIHNNPTKFYCGTNIRTNLPPYPMTAVSDYNSTFHGLSMLEVADCPMMYFGTNTFTYCSALRKVLNVWGISSGGWTTTFTGCINLKEINIAINGQSADIVINFEDCRVLSLESLQYLVAHKASAATAKKTTVTVHADIYAKITGGKDSAWSQLLTDAAARNITFTTP